MRLIFFALLFGICTHASAQKDLELGRLIRQARLEEAIDKARQYLSVNPEDEDALIAMGLAKYYLHDHDSAEYYLKLADKECKRFSNNFYVIRMQLAFCYYFRDNKEQITEVLSECGKRKGGARGKWIYEKTMALLGTSDLYNNWYTLETKHIIFHIQDTNGIKNLNEFAEAHELAYETVNKKFNVQPGKKINFYVWEKLDDAKKALGKGLGFAKPELYLTHSYKMQSKGHELTHILSYWGTGGRENYNKLINEGIAEVFDLDGDDDIARAKEHTQNLYIGDIRNVWLNPDHYSDKVLYPLGGALVMHLMKNGTEAQLMSIIKDQSIEHAREVYGAEFDRLLNEFNAIMGFK